MTSWLERVRAALAPKGYDVERELASGGMGTVFLARQRTLDRPVAVKVIRPELHTAPAAARFRREARILASFTHPNIVPIYDADEADGMPYCVMEYVEGENLADRLRSGPLPRPQALKVGRDLLDALEAAHAHGVVHRDVKPSNVFLVGESAKLGDFGIAKRLPSSADSSSDGALTEPGVVPGTRYYMSPEQYAGSEATTASDLYAAALVIYEAYTARKFHDAPRASVWEGVPARVAAMLRRALELSPEARWPDAASFRRALWHTREWPYQRRTIAIAIACLIGGAIVWSRWGPLLTDWLSDVVVGRPRGPARVEIRRFTASGRPEEGWLADSLACSLAGGLRGYPDLVVRGPCDAGGWGLLRWKRTALEGQVRTTGDSAFVSIGPRGGGWQLAASIPVAEWRPGVAELSGAVFDSLLGGGSALEPSLPRDVRPKTPEAKRAFLEGEHAFAQALWGEAYAWYGRAAQADTACWICFWRHAEVGRWLGLAEDTFDVARYQRARTLFPPFYQRLIAAEGQPLEKRLRDFEGVARRWPAFFLGLFRFADELYHRGPLVGHERREALTPFNAVLSSGPPAFGPAWEHLAMAYIADGDSAAAASALARLHATGPSRDAITVQVRALVEVAFACRFLGSARCRGVIQRQIREAEAAGGTSIDAGARYLPYFGAQVGAIEVGRVLEARPELARSALFGEAFGALGLGQLDSTRAALRRIQDRYGGSSVALVADELEAALILFDPDSAQLARWPSVRAALVDRAGLPPADERRRAAWILALVSRRLGGTGDAGRPPRAPADEAPPHALERLTWAMEAASRNDVREALTLSEPLIEMEAEAADPDPFFRTVLHLLRADWYERAGSREGARRELIWYENSDVYRYPVGDPELAEVDWAFGTLARWRLARLLDRPGEAGDAACRAYADVQRLWSRGDPRYRVRADSAARRLAELHCTVGS